MADDLLAVREILNGNIDSFNKIIHKYEASIFRFILGMVRDSEATKDLTQEVFIAVYNKLYTFKGQQKFSSWLFTIAKNKSIDYIRKNRMVIKLNIEEAYDISSKELLPEQYLELKETKKEIKSFIDSLDKIDRQILILKTANNDWRFIDIAEVLNISASTVKSKYYRLWDKYNNFIKKKDKR